MSTPFKECPSCGAHLDAGERCDCKETAAADRAQANTARITPPARAYDKHVRPIEKTIKSVVREASRKERILCSST